MSAGEIVIMAAMEIELKPLLSKFRKLSSKFPRIYEGEIQGERACCVVSGIGGNHAETAAKAAVGRKPRLILSVGFAGGLSKRLNAGDRFIASRVVDSDGLSLPCQQPPDLPSGIVSAVLLTSDHIVRTPGEKKMLAEDADAADMETFPIARAAQLNRIPFHSLRIVSDSHDEELPFDFSGMIRDGEVSAGKMIAKMLLNPWKIFPVVKLGMRAKRLAARLSEDVRAVVAELREKAP